MIILVNLRRSGEREVESGSEREISESDRERVDKVNERIQ